MTKYKVILLDVDGVLLLNPKYFSHAYAEEKGLDKERFDNFFGKYATDVARGKTDYRQLIIQHNDVWEWDKSPDELLDKWFSYENTTNKKLIELVKKARGDGVLVYLASDQDKYRARYLKEVLFSDLIDGAFISSEIRHNKAEAQFFEFVVRQLIKKYETLKPAEILFLDDLKHNIDSAKTSGISAFLYRDPSQVAKLLGFNS